MVQRTVGVGLGLIAAFTLITLGIQSGSPLLAAAGALIAFGSGFLSVPEPKARVSETPDEDPRGDR